MNKILITGMIDDCTKSVWLSSDDYEIYHEYKILKKPFIFQYFIEIFQEEWKFQDWNMSKWKFYVKYFTLKTQVIIS